MRCEFAGSCSAKDSPAEGYCGGSRWNTTWYVCFQLDAVTRLNLPAYIQVRLRLVSSRAITTSYLSFWRLRVLCVSAPISYPFTKLTSSSLVVALSFLPHYFYVYLLANPAHQVVSPVSPDTSSQTHRGPTLASSPTSDSAYSSGVAYSITAFPVLCRI